MYHVNTVAQRRKLEQQFTMCTIINITNHVLQLCLLEKFLHRNSQIGINVSTGTTVQQYVLKCNEHTVHHLRKQRAESVRHMLTET